MRAILARVLPVADSASSGWSPTATSASTTRSPTTWRTAPAPRQPGDDADATCAPLPEPDPTEPPGGDGRRVTGEPSHLPFMPMRHGIGWHDTFRDPAGAAGGYSAESHDRHSDALRTASWRTEA